MPRPTLALIMGLFLSVSTASLPSFSQSSVTRVWAVGDGEKIRRDDLSHWAARSPDNAVWDGTTIRLFGARNEIVAFQLILEARSSSATDVNVRLESLAGSGYIIANRSGNDDPFDYRGRFIELFLEHYVNVTQRSSVGATAAWSAARPLPDSDHLGWIPDALIPFQATPGTTNWVGGAPFDIGAGRNQGVWVDLTIPRDASPGTYRGTVYVSENNRQRFAIPIELQVYGFTLPDATHLHNTFFILPSMLTRHPGISVGSTAYWKLFQKYMHLAHRHRMDLTDGRRTVAEFDAHLKDYYTGARYNPASGYDGPGTGVGNTTYSIGTYDQPSNGRVSGFDPATREAWWAAANAWERWFRANAPDVLRYKFMIDEAGHDTAALYPIIRRRAGWIKSNPGIGRNLPIYCTVKMDPRLKGSVDFWSLTGQSGYDPGDGIPQGYTLKGARERRASGERVGIYNSNRPSYGIFEWIDNVATDPRVIPWVSWKYDVDEYFLWETGQVYNQTSQRKQNPWVKPYYAYDGGKVIWGLGTVLYTGNDEMFPSESRGIDGPIASIRIKNWRRGQQDYEYMRLAEQAGLDPRPIVEQIVPAAFDDYKGAYTSQRSQAAFAERGHKFDKSRRQLADLIKQARTTSILPTGTFSASPSTLLAAGGRVTLSWTTTGAASVTLDHGIGPVAPSGSTTVVVNAPTTFTMTLRNDAGSIVRTAVVSMPPPPPPPSGANIVANGGFESGSSSWKHYHNGGSDNDFSVVTSSPVPEGSQKAKVMIDETIGTNNQLYQTGIELSPASAYRITFAHHASATTSFRVRLIEENDDHTSYGFPFQTVTSTTSVRTFSHMFTTSGFTGTVSDAMVQFYFVGGTPSRMIYLDDVEIVRVGLPKEAVLPPSLPAEFSLKQNYPNPFNPSTTLEFSMMADGDVSLEVFNMLGERVAVPASGYHSAGEHRVVWGATSDRGVSLPSGTYLLRMRTGGFVATRRMLLLR